MWAVERADGADASRVGCPSRDTTTENVTRRQGSTLMGLGFLAPPSTPRRRSPAGTLGPRSATRPAPPLMGFPAPRAQPAVTRSIRTSTATSALVAGRHPPCSADEGFGNQRGAFPNARRLTRGAFGTQGSSLSRGPAPSAYGPFSLCILGTHIPVPRGERTSEAWAHPVGPRSIP